MKIVFIVLIIASFTSALLQKDPKEQQSQDKELTIDEQQKEATNSNNATVSDDVKESGKYVIYETEFGDVIIPEGEASSESEIDAQDEAADQPKGEEEGDDESPPFDEYEDF